jgi:hypothetical protein
MGGAIATRRGESTTIFHTWGRGVQDDDRCHGRRVDRTRGLIKSSMNEVRRRWEKSVKMSCKQGDEVDGADGAQPLNLLSLFFSHGQ